MGENLGYDYDRLANTAGFSSSGGVKGGKLEKFKGDYNSFPRFV